MSENERPRIRILENGPYLVSGNVPLDEKVMVTDGHHRKYENGRALPQSESYALCRCGHSENPPFCDGMHATIGFDGEETADRASFDDRAEILGGPTLDLYDDNRCAFARFCHQKDGSVWELTEESDDPDRREQAIAASTNCPAGRLVHHDKQNDYAEIEPELLPAISVLQDPEKDVSGPLFVQGGVELIGADGVPYERRNRYTLCRCGASQNRPFCDASHVAGYKDGL
ncbi:MAG TPA: iron-binding protein [Coriobacteriia bacterium]|nr:iron-binding protein [Coriobacteriia bacterium]